VAADAGPILDLLAFFELLRILSSGRDADRDRANQNHPDDGFHAEFSN
jgi:hypothetical protein